MYYKKYFKLLTLILLIYALLSGCDKKNENNQNKSQDTLNNLSNTPLAEDYQNESSPTLTADKSSGIFSDISDFEIVNPKTYFDERFKFSVDYPEASEIYVDDNPDTGSPDGDPQGGIYIYFDSNKNDWMYIYGQDGHIGLSMYGENSEEFLTSEGSSGRIKYFQSEGRIMFHLVLDEGFNGVTVNADEKVFDKNKQQILGILKSIKINLE